MPSRTDVSSAQTDPKPGGCLLRRCLIEIAETALSAALIYLVLHTFVAEPFEVQQRSMFPTITSGAHLVADKLSPAFGGYDYGDVVVFAVPSDVGLSGDTPFIKRVIGLPGDTVSLADGRVLVARAGEPPRLIDEPYLPRIDGLPQQTGCLRPDCPQSWTVGPGEMFVMGDNRPASHDSRTFGPIDSSSLIGRAWLRYYPFEDFGLIDNTGWHFAEP